MSRWCQSVQAHEEARSACSTPRTAALPGPARWRATCISTKAHDAAIRQMAYDYVTDDAIPVLHLRAAMPIDLEAYRDVVLDRFGNPRHCRHQPARGHGRVFPRSPA